jgi:hypothetical protein
VEAGAQNTPTKGHIQNTQRQLGCSPQAAVEETRNLWGRSGPPEDEAVSCGILATISSSYGMLSYL